MEKKIYELPKDVFSIIFKCTSLKNLLTRTALISKPFNLIVETVLSYPKKIKDFNHTVKLTEKNLAKKWLVFNKINYKNRDLLKLIKKYANIQFHLEFNFFNSKITNANLNFIFKNYKHIKELDLRGCEQINLHKIKKEILKELDIIKLCVDKKEDVPDELTPKIKELELTQLSPNANYHQGGWGLHFATGDWQKMRLTINFF